MYFEKFLKIFFIFFIFFFLIYMIYSNYIKKDNSIKTQETLDIKEDITSTSNLIKDVEYNTKDANGNEYLIKALEGEIDFSNTNFIFYRKPSRGGSCFLRMTCQFCKTCYIQFKNKC